MPHPKKILKETVSKQQQGRDSSRPHRHILLLPTRLCGREESHPYNLTNFDATSTFINRAHSANGHIEATDATEKHKSTREVPWGDFADALCLRWGYVLLSKEAQR